jgi:hypothetical protein
MSNYYSVEGKIDGPTKLFFLGGCMVHVCGSGVWERQARDGTPA